MAMSTTLKERQDRGVALYLGGMEVAAIAAEMQCSRQTLYRWLAYAGVTLRGSMGPNAPVYAGSPHSWDLDALLAASEARNREIAAHDCTAFWGDAEEVAA